MTGRVSISQRAHLTSHIKLCVEVICLSWFGLEPKATWFGIHLCDTSTGETKRAWINSAHKPLPFFFPSLA
jgi:hypothetical protein